MVMTILYLTHIIAGIFWAGAILIIAGFVRPAVDAAGPAGGMFMNKLTTETRFTVAMSAGGGLTVLSGLIMYWLVSGGFASAWLGSTHGILITLGAVCGLLAMIVGIVYSKKAAMRMGQLSGEIEAGGKAPNDAQQAEIAALKLKMRKGINYGALLILITITCMALARTI